MVRVLAIVIAVYAISYPRVLSDLQATATTAGFGGGETRAERLMADFSGWLQGPIDRLLAAYRTSGGHTL